VAAMDFHTLLYQAQKNNNKDKEVKYFKASLDPPKKETKEGRQLSDSIKKFLAKKEEEDRLKLIEEQKKKMNYYHCEVKIENHLNVCSLC
jgi:protein SPT2